MSDQPDRRRSDRRATPRALVPTLLNETVDDAAPASPAEPVGPDPAYAAQLIGQAGQKRGLKGGQPVLEAARSAYLGTEHSGAADRRPRVGQVKRTEI